MKDFDDTALQSLKHLRDTKNVLEKRKNILQDDVNKLEEQIVESDRLKTQVDVEVELVLKSTNNDRSRRYMTV